ncbi:MAG TPA: sulfatase [Candidatus Brocadiia bacterium]|nr:sulfatase [Candidatus Brocadiia bacterium]
MNRRDFLRNALAGAASLSIPSAFAAAQEHKPTNIVFILADDLGWRDLGCFGSSFYETPNLDRLASEGMRFTNAYAACPVCSPTRASIMAGKYPARMKTTDYFGAPQPEAAMTHKRFANMPLLPAPYLNRLPLEEITIAEALKNAGYSTFFAGKWHLGGEGYYPEEQGFDINKGGYQGGGLVSYFSPYKNPKLEDGPVGEHLPARLAAESVKFLKQNGNRPFLLYLSFHSVHIPLQGRKDLVEKYVRKNQGIKHDGPLTLPEGKSETRQVQDHAVYAAMVEAMDSAIGDVLKALDGLGLAGNTAVFFMSDNGGLSTAEGSPTSNIPLRAGKGWLYEGGIREPMIVRWPDVAKPGTVCDSSVISTDFYPTVLDIAGLSQMPQQHMDGISFAPLLKGGKIPDRGPIFWHYPHYGNQGGAPGGAVRDGDWKLIEWYEDGRLELFNLRSDVGEKENLASRMPDKAQEMRQKLRVWRENVGAVMPTPNPNAARK